MISAINRDRIARIAGLYSTRLADGTQGFVELKTRKGRVYAWLDNYFEPVANTFSYCNDVLWPIALSSRADRTSRRFDRQEEYLRVFGR